MHMRVKKGGCEFADDSNRFLLKYPGQAFSTYVTVRTRVPFVEHSNKCR
eukprot:COSAG05_NODE_877_length_6812_cov_6.263370_7_plen_49_part_00